MSALIQSLNESNFQATVSGGLVLVDFWAPWCGPCRMQGPILERVANEVSGWATVMKLNVDEAQSLAARFGIQSIPTLLILKDGKVVDMRIGVQSQEVLVSALRKHHEG